MDYADNKNVAFLNNFNAWPLRLAPKAIVSAIKVALVDLHKHQDLDYAVNDLPDDILMAKAVWDLRASKAVDNDEALPAKEPIERLEIKLANAKADLLPSEYAAIRAANTMGTVIRANTTAWQDACESRAIELVNQIAATLEELQASWREADTLLRTSYLLQTGWGQSNERTPGSGARRMPLAGLGGTINDVREITPWAPTITPSSAPTADQRGAVSTA